MVDNATVGSAPMRLLGIVVAAMIVASCATIAPRVAPVIQPTEWEQLEKTVVDLWGQERPLEAWVRLQNSPWRDDRWRDLNQRAVNRLVSAAPSQDLTRTLFRAHLTSTPLNIPGQSASDPGSSGPAQWIQGTVTVLVNKGLKLEAGTATPDIVLGSGFFVDDQGLILTNAHVIESALDPQQKNSPRISVRLADSHGERLPAKLVGWDRNSDLALLKVEYRPNFVLRWNTDESLAAGQRLRAVGSPGGFEASVTEGIVSSLKRPLLPLGNVYQIDVAVNPGNSGGPLVDDTGRVVGVVFAGIAEFQGVNFAIPATLVGKILPRLKQGGRSLLPWLGIGLQDALQGVEVVYVLPQGAADRAGLRVGDRIVALDGQKVSDIAEAQSALLGYGHGEAIPVQVERDGNTVTRWSTFDVRPDDPLKLAFETDLAGRVFPLAFGIELEDLGSPIDRNFRVKRVWAGSDGEALQLVENDPLLVLDWASDDTQKLVEARVIIKRRLGGYFETQVALGAPWAFRQFL